MLETIKGYYNGKQIVLDDSVKLKQGQEVTVTYINEGLTINAINHTDGEDEDIAALVDSLVGSVPNSGKTLEEYRNERLSKYESLNWYKCGSWYAIE